MTIVIARRSQNICTIVSLLAGYAAACNKDPSIDSLRYHADLTESGMFSVSTFTRDNSNWSLNIEHSVIPIIDLLMKCGAGFVGTKGSALTGLDFYTNRAPYRFEEDAELLE